MDYQKSFHFKQGRIYVQWHRDIFPIGLNLDLKSGFCACSRYAFPFPIIEICACHLPNTTQQNVFDNFSSRDEKSECCHFFPMARP